MNNLIIDSIKYRINVLNRNWLGIICGESGSGKSYSALKLSELIDPEFNIDRVIFTPEEFFEILNSGKLHKGNALIWDEVGVGLPAREFYTITNKDVNYILQSFRKDNLAVIFTTPGISFVDVQARRLFHALIETLFILYDENCVVAKYLEIQYNPRYDKIYMKYPRIENNGRIITIKTLNIGKPSEKLADAYEEKAKEYKDRLKKEKQKEILFEKRRKGGKRINTDEMVEEVESNLKRFQTEYRGRIFIDPYLIMEKFNVGYDSARKIRAGVERKITKTG